MRRIASSLFLLASFALFLPFSAAAQAVQDNQMTARSLWEGWSVNGYNTLRHDYYNIDGNRSASPFQFGGGQSYDEWDVNIAKNFSPYRKVRGQFFGVLNDSEYRSPKKGLVAERMSLFYEDGEGELPYRVELGDYFSGLSYRVQQRMLKGASVELQPWWSGDVRHSVILFSGTGLPYYRDFDVDNDASTGASWLIEHSRFGRFSFNTLYNYQDEPTATLTGTRNSQRLYSIGWEKDVRVASQAINFSAEAARFDGDYASVTDKQDTGYFSELYGYSADKSLPVDYRLRYERYGQNYRPNGALITPNRQSFEAHAGWRFDSGLQLRGRAQRFEDRFDSFNEQNTKVFGAQLLGRLLGNWAPSLSGSADLFTQSIRTDLRDIDRDSDTFQFGLSHPFVSDWTAEFSGFLQDAEDHTIANRDATTRQITIGGSHPLKIGEFYGSVRPSLALRKIDYSGNNESIELKPALAFQLANDDHRLSASYGYLNQNRLGTALVDTAIQNASLDYAYTFGNHEIGLSASYFDRAIDRSLDTDAYRIGVYWTVRFGESMSDTVPAATALAANQNNLSGTGVGSVPAFELAGASILTELTPGMTLQKAQELLTSRSIQAPARTGQVYAYEANLLKAIPARQRLAVKERAGKLVDAALLIDTDTLGTPQTVLQTYEGVKAALVKQFGKPVRIVEEGQLTDNALPGIVQGNVIRVAEWETPSGRLRLGIPRQLDGDLRIEIHHAASFPGARNPNWGMTEVR